MRHNLDEEVEDILQHYGIKGMKWGVRRSQEQIEMDEAAAAGGGGEEEEEEEGLLDDVKDKLEEVGEAMTKTLSEIGDKAKKAGSALLTAIFGTTEDSRREDRVNGRAITNAFVQELKIKEGKMKPSERRNAQELRNDAINDVNSEIFREALKKGMDKKKRDVMRKKTSLSDLR